MNAEIKTGIIFGGLIAAGVVFLAILFIGLDESVSIIQDSGIKKGSKFSWHIQIISIHRLKNYLKIWRIK